MPGKKRTVSGLGKRLRDIRRAKGLSQIELARSVGTSQRSISHYETEIASPTAGILLGLSRALDISIDDLLAIRRTRTLPQMDAASTRLWNKLRKIRALPESGQRAVFKMIEMALRSHGLGPDQQVGEQEPGRQARVAARP